MSSASVASSQSVVVPGYTAVWCLCTVLIVRPLEGARENPLLACVSTTRSLISPTRATKVAADIASDQRPASSVKDSTSDTCAGMW
jgi:hypothetical protein